MVKRLSAGLLLPAVLLFVSACGGSGASGSATPSGPAMSDEEYLKAICTGVTQLSDALVSKSNVDDITKVIKDFSASVKALNPPADLRKYNADFAKYLDDTASDPTAVLTKKPPVPADSIRQRLASKESNVPECKGPTFFDAGQAAATATSK